MVTETKKDLNLDRQKLASFLTAIAISLGASIFAIWRFSILFSDVNFFESEKFVLNFKVAFSAGVYMGLMCSGLYGAKCAVHHYAFKSDWNMRWTAWYLVHPFSGVVSSALGMQVAISFHADMYLLKDPASASKMLLIAAVAGYKGTQFIDRLVLASYSSLGRGTSDDKLLPSKIPQGRNTRIKDQSTVELRAVD